MSFSIDSAFAHPHSGQIMVNSHTHESQTEISPLNESIGLEKSTVFFHASEVNKLPWGFVEGKIEKHVEGYPVIIQIFNRLSHGFGSRAGRRGHRRSGVSVPVSRIASIWLVWRGANCSGDGFRYRGYKSLESAGY